MPRTGRMPRLVIELSRRSARAVEVTARGASVRLERVWESALPASVPADDTAAVGAWLSDALDAAGFPRRASILALPREAVVARRLSLPTSSADEVPDMARLAMQRELPLDGGEVAIDSAPLVTLEGETEVLGVGMPLQALQWACDCLGAAHRPAGVATVRALGAVALARRDSIGARKASELVVDVTDDAVELAVVGDWPGASLGFSRGAALRLDAPEQATNAGATGQETRRSVADAVAAEAKRSLLGWRLVGGEERDDRRADPESIALLAASALRGDVRQALAASTGLTVREVRVNEVLRATTDPGACAALGGLFLPECVAVDLLHPRRAPDRAARRRQWAYIAAGLLIIAGLAGYTVGRREAAETARRRDDIAEKARSALTEGWRLRRDEDKLRHVRQWPVPPTEWLEELIYVKELLPEAGDVVLDSVTASQEFSGVRWEKPRASSAKGAQAEGAPRWTSAAEIRIELQGEAKTRAIADSLREKLIADSRFKVTTSGMDARGGNRLPYPFGYLLRSIRQADAPTEDGT